MRLNPWLASFLSFLFPGLGQVYIGKKKIGITLMLACIVIGNLNALWLSLYAGVDTDMSFMSHTLPLLLHRIFAVYGIVFWVWQVIDAYRLAKQSN